MKLILLLILTFLSLTVTSQNILYFERQSPYSDFAIGNGKVAVKEVGVSSTLTILVKYKQLIGGVPVSTGWIPHTGGTYSDVYNDTIQAVGVYYGDTLIQSKHLFDVNNYEVINVTASGFDNHGVYNSSLPWSINFYFDGPTTNSDAEVQQIIGAPIQSVNNILTLNETTSFISFPHAYNLLSFNSNKSFISIRTSNIGYPPTYETGPLLNAYIPRVTSRPNTANDCDGVISFERLQMIGDINLEFSINGSTFTPLTNDVFSGICAFDTIKVLGFSPTVMIGDTLVETQYVLRSIDSLNSNDLDLSQIEIQLNLGSNGSSGCDNKLTFDAYSGTPGAYGYGLVLNDLGEYTSIVNESPFNEYARFCQSKYHYAEIYLGSSFSTSMNLAVVNYFSFTILDVNNETHGTPVYSSIDQYYTDSLTCTSDLVITRESTPAFYQGISYSPFIGNSPSTYILDDAVGIDSYTDSITYSELCPGMYSFNHDYRNKFVFVTDSLQQLDVSYSNLFGNGLNENYMAVPEIDTLKLYYNECNNDYSQPFTTVNLNKSNSTVSTVNYSNSGFNIEEFNISFDLTQGANSYSLHERPVQMIDYSYLQNSTPYYTITELFCETNSKSMIKKRKIIIAPDGTITDLFNGATAIEKENISQYFNIYPNPATNEITISSDKKWLSYSIFNMNGLNMINGKNSNNLQSYKLSISHLENGIYILQINGENAVHKKLIVKQ